MKQPNVIVMPTRNCNALTRDAVRSCLAQDIQGGVEVWCMDDGSSDGVRQWTQTLHPRVRTFCRPNAGVSKLWNAALTHAFDILGVPHALVVNSDVRLRPDAYKRLVDDGGLFVTCVGTSSGANWPGGEPSGETRPHPDFSCFLIRRECWQRVGAFDEQMRIYTSDGDYHLRMHQVGIDAYCLDLPFFHYASGTLKQAEPEDRDRILAIAQADREAFERKWGWAMGSGDYYKAFGTGAPE